MTAKNFGTGVSRTLDPKGRSWLHVVLNQGRPALEYEINLLQDVGLARMADDQRRLLPSGFLSAPEFGSVDSDEHPNAFFLPTEDDLTPLVAHVNGWTLSVRGTSVADLVGGTMNNLANRIFLSAPPATGARTDIVYLEVWLSLVTGNSDTQPTKPPSRSRLDSLGQVVQKSQVWPFGNMLYGGQTLDDDIVDPEVNLETTKRIQLQYAIRTWENVDLSQYPRGLGDPAIAGIGPQETPPAYGTAFRNFGDESGDYGLWVSELPDLTVDGLVYAIPICAVHRRNSAGFDEDINPNGSSPSADADLALRPDGFASDRVVLSDFIDLRHNAVLSPSGLPSVGKLPSDAFAGVLATSFGTDPVSADVSGSMVSVQKKIVAKANLSLARSDHVGFCDGIRRVFGDEPTVEKNVFMAIGHPTPAPTQEFPDAWNWEAAGNTIELTLPASSDSRFSERWPRAVLSVTQEDITFNSVELSVTGKTMTLTFGLPGGYRDGGELNGRHYKQDIWLYFDIEVPASPGLRAEPLEMQPVHARSLATTNLSPPSTRRVATTIPNPDANNTFYGTIHKGPDNRMPSAPRPLPSPLRDATVVEDVDGTPTKFFGGMLDLDDYLGGVDSKPLADAALTLELLSRRLDGLVDMDDDLRNIDAGWVSGRHAMFARPLNSTTTSDGSAIDIKMSTHATYIIRDISLPSGIALFTVLNSLPLVHLRGVHLVPQLSSSEYTEGGWIDSANPSAGIGELAGHLVENEECTLASIVYRGDGVNTYRLTEGGLPLALPVMQVLRIDKKNPADGTWILGAEYQAGILKKGGGKEEMIVPVYIREGGITNQVAFVKRIEKSGGAVEYEAFEFSDNPSSTDWVGNYRITYRALSDITSAPLDTDILIGDSDYVTRMVTEYPDTISPGKQGFENAGLRNGYEMFIDADIRVPLPIDAEIDAPVIHAPTQTASLETDWVTVTDVAGSLLLATASSARLGDAVMPGYAAYATEHVAVSQAPPDGDFRSEGIGLADGSIQSGSAVWVPVVASAGRNPVRALLGQRVQLRPSSATGVFDALLGSDGNPVRVVAEATSVSSDGDLAAFLPLTAVAETGEVVVLLLSQRNLADRDTASPSFGTFKGNPAVDTGDPAFTATVYRPSGRPLVRGGADARPV